MSIYLDSQLIRRLNATPPASDAAQGLLRHVERVDELRREVLTLDAAERHAANELNQARAEHELTQASALAGGNVTAADSKRVDARVRKATADVGENTARQARRRIVQQALDQAWATTGAYARQHDLELTRGHNAAILQVTEQAGEHLRRAAHELASLRETVANGAELMRLVGAAGRRFATEEYIQLETLLNTLAENGVPAPTLPLPDADAAEEPVDAEPSGDVLIRSARP